GGRSILVLGAGGASRGILEPLLRAGPASLVIANRTVSRAEELATAFADLGRVSGCGFGQLAGQRFNVIINATSASLSGELPPLPDDLLSDHCCCYDLAYGAEPTPFMRWAASRAAWAVAD